MHDRRVAVFELLPLIVGQRLCTAALWCLARPSARRVCWCTLYHAANCRDSSNAVYQQVSASSAASLSMAASDESHTLGDLKKQMSAAALAGLLLLPVSAHASKEQLGGNFKVLQGAASTQDSGSRRTITRGAVLDRSDFSNQNLAGVSFQVRLLHRPDSDPSIRYLSVATCRWPIAIG